MPRAKRLDIAGVAQHVIQRGNDRQPCFFREADYLRYLQDLREASLRFDCRVQAYALMTNHVHLLVTSADVGAVGRMMQALGRRYVRKPYSARRVGFSPPHVHPLHDELVISTRQFAQVSDPGPTKGSSLAHW